MRRGNKADIVVDNDVKVGFTLGSDWCAEHEWGIKEIRKAFGMQEVDGLERYVIRQQPRMPVFFFRRGNDAVLVYQPSFACNVARGEMDKVEQYAFSSSQFHRFQEEMVIGAWDEQSFGIRTFGKEMSDFLEEVYKAFQDLNIVITMAPGMFLENSGLVVAIKSRIPASVDERYKEAHEDHRQLLKAAEETGIESRLKAAGLNFFALSPRWISEENKDKSKHPVLFWLNPMEQDIYNAMWCTVEVLDEWIEGRGPIVKASKKKKD
jgi:hypothetical protein